PTDIGIWDLLLAMEKHRTTFARREAAFRKVGFLPRMPAEGETAEDRKDKFLKDKLADINLLSITGLPIMFIEKEFYQSYVFTKGDPAVLFKDQPGLFILVNKAQIAAVQEESFLFWYGQK